MNADGSDLTRLTDDPAWDSLSAWSPDGQRIVFTSDRDGDPNIYTMNVDGGDLTQPTDLDHASFPVWSPDGQQTAFKFVVHLGNNDICVMNAEGSNQTRLTHDEARTDLFFYVEAFYNRRRRHSALDYLSPYAYECLYYQEC